MSPNASVAVCTPARSEIKPNSEARRGLFEWRNQHWAQGDGSVIFGRGEDDGGCRMNCSSGGSEMYGGAKRERSVRGKERTANASGRSEGEDVVREDRGIRGEITVEQSEELLPHEGAVND